VKGADYFQSMDAFDQPSLLSIPARLLETEGLSDRRRDAWRILFSDRRLFQERRTVVDGVEEIFYDVVEANLIPLIAKECRESNALLALAFYCEARIGMKSATEELAICGVEQGVAQHLPQEPAGGETLRSAVLGTAVAQARIAGRDQFLTQLQDHLHEAGMTEGRAGSWQGALLSFEEASWPPTSSTAVWCWPAAGRSGKQKKTVFMLTISTETGMLTMGPARDLNHKETQVIDLADGRRPIGFFVGGEDGEVFNALLGGAVAGWLQGEDGDASEKTALREAWSAWSGNKRKGETLDDYLQRGDKASNQQFSRFLAAQGKEHSMCPVQTIAGFGGDIHLGALPEGVLSRLLEQGRKLTGVITQPDGSQTEVALGHFPDEAEAEKLVEQHSRAWPVENRNLRLEMIRQSEQELHQGSIGFLKIMRGSVNLGDDADGGNWIRGGVEGDIGSLLETIEAHYSREERDEPPAGLKDLCERFLSDTNVPEEKQSTLREAMASYNDKMGVAERNDFYRKVATYMVDRFSQGIEGSKRDELILGLDALVGAAARTRFLYLVTDPATRTTHVDIAGNLSERIDALGKENGTMVIVACYAIKSIPVVQWSTGFMDFLAGSETSRGDGSSIVAKGKVGASTEAERVARARWANLGRRFGYSRDGETKTPDSMVEFLCGGVHRMIAEDGRDLAEFIVPYGDATGKNEAAREAARETVKARVADFLKNKFQADGPKDPEHIIPQAFFSSMAELWVATHGNIAFGDATTQRACISSLNGALSSLFSTHGEAGEAARIKRALDAGAELISPAEGGIDSDTLNKISRYGEHLGAKACEWDIHQSLASLRMGKSEMFYVGANYPEFLSIIEKRMGQGVVGRRYLMGRPGRDGERARRAKETLSTTVQPNSCMQWRADRRNVLSKLAAVARQRPEIVDRG
jgi:hypothetical protein